MAWLLEIGQRLRAEYDYMLTAPLPERLAALLKQFESSAKASKQEINTSQ
jgi:anti-sigma factor NepR-like protein